MGELEFARLCRDHGLPAPVRKSLRRSPRGTAYLDAEWPQYGVVVEIDGVHHLSAPVAVGDALRQNRLMLDSARVLRVPNLGLRVAPEEFIAQIRRALEAGGWRDVMRIGRPGDQDV